MFKIGILCACKTCLKKSWQEGTRRVRI